MTTTMENEWDAAEGEVLRQLHFLRASSTAPREVAPVLADSQIGKGTITASFDKDGREIVRTCTHLLAISEEDTTLTGNALEQAVDLFRHYVSTTPGCRCDVILPDAAGSPVKFIVTTGDLESKPKSYANGLAFTVTGTRYPTIEEVMTELSVSKKGTKEISYNIDEKKGTFKTTTEADMQKVFKLRKSNDNTFDFTFTKI